MFLCNTLYWIFAVRIKVYARSNNQLYIMRGIVSAPLQCCSGPLLQRAALRWQRGPSGLTCIFADVHSIKILPVRGAEFLSTNKQFKYIHIRPFTTWYAKRRAFTSCVHPSMVDISDITMLGPSMYTAWFQYPICVLQSFNWIALKNFKKTYNRKPRNANGTIHTCAKKQCRWDWRNCWWCSCPSGRVIRCSCPSGRIMISYTEPVRVSTKRLSPSPEPDMFGHPICTPQKPNLAFSSQLSCWFWPALLWCHLFGWWWTTAAKIPSHLTRRQAVEASILALWMLKTCDREIY